MVQAPDVGDGKYKNISKTKIQVWVKEKQQERITGQPSRLKGYPPTPSSHASEV